MNTNFTDLIKSFEDNVTIRDLKSGTSVISGFGNGIRLSGTFNESMINANLSNKGEALYSLNQKNISLEEVRESLSQIVNMFVKSRDVMEGVEDFDAAQEEETEEKELLLDDIPGDLEPTSTSTAPAEDNKVSLEIREEPIPEDADLEASLESVMSFRDELNALADRSTKLLTKFAKDDHENRLLAIGLISGLYSISEDIADFIENITENIEDLATEKKKTAKDADKKENLSVPAKVNYMKMARGGVSQACSALKKTGECEDLLNILKDVKSEMVIRQK